MRSTVVFGVFCSVATVAEADIDSWIESSLDSLSELYVYLHTHPELSYEEKETSARIAAEWDASGYEVTRNVHPAPAPILRANGHTQS